MQIFRGFRHPGVAPACALTIGNFDGVHRGHQAMLALLNTEARHRGLPSCVLTFEPHPRDYFAGVTKKPELAPARIATLRTALENYRQQGAAGFEGFRDALKTYVAHEWHHMNTEEGQIFPLATAHLTPEGGLKLDDGVSGPGRYVEMRAETDVRVLISNCPQLNNPCNAYNPTPVRLLVWDPQ